MTTINGTDRDETITGTNDSDTLYGKGGKDQLVGLDGDDWISGGTGDDYMIGGPGNDTYEVDSLGDRIEEKADGGTDTVVAYVNGYTLPANVEILRLAIGIKEAYGNDQDNVLDGRLTAFGATIGGYTFPGGLTLDGRGGNDTIYGSLGDDRLYGGSGDDHLFGSGGKDLMDGGAGDDTFDKVGAGSTLIGGMGDDTYILGKITSVTLVEGKMGCGDTVVVEATYKLPDNIEQLVLRGTDAIDGTGNEQNNAITGNLMNNTLSGMGGNDNLYGGAGTDTLDGGDGQDRLFGGYSADVLTGGTGNDWLDGGQGKDTLTGGSGMDTFSFGKDYYRLGANHEVLGRTIQGNADVVTDFKSGEDRIALSVSTFDALDKAGAKAGGEFTKDFLLNGRYAKDANDFFLYDAKTGELWYDWNGNQAADGWTGKRLVATFDDGHGNHPLALSASDFILIA